MTLPLLIVELGVPQRKTPAQDPSVAPAANAPRAAATPAAATLLRLLSRFDAPPVEDLVEAACRGGAGRARSKP